MDGCVCCVGHLIRYGKQSKRSLGIILEKNYLGKDSAILVAIVFVTVQNVKLIHNAILSTIIPTLILTVR
jgi:hypothetical protein